MATLSAVQRAVWQFASERNVWILPSALYDLYPARSRLSSNLPPLSWPARWPNDNSHGLYLFFADAPGAPELLYVGKASKRTSSIRTRLDGYIDLKEFRATGRCKLRDEWNGYKRPWGTEPRYVVTIGLETDSDTGECKTAEEMEGHLIRELHPPENSRVPG